MPLLRTINPWPEATVYLWDINESEDELMAMSQVNHQSKIRLDSMKSEVHRKGFLSVRALLQRADLTDDEVYYNHSGKPFLRTGQHISITHSHSRSAIIVAPYPVGIDIELRRSKILRIGHKFSSGISLALKQLVPEPVDQYTYVWTAKESIYKIAAHPGLGFLNNILLGQWSIEKGTPVDASTQKHNETWIHATGTINYPKERHFAYQGCILDQYVCGMTRDLDPTDIL